MTASYHLGRMFVIGAAFDDAVVPPYSRVRWSSIFNHLAQILGTRGKPSIRARRVDSDYKTVKTGRPQWSKDDSQLWLGTEEENPLGYFFDMDVAFPTWPTCAKKRVSPTAYFAMKRSFGEGKRASTCVIALEVEAMRSALPMAYRLVRALQPSDAAQCGRLWGDPALGGEGFSNAISNGVSYRELTSRDGPWQPLTSAELLAAAEP